MSLFLASLLSVTEPQAARIYINDVRADSLTNVELKNVDLRIDANGDLYISAPQYDIQVTGEAQFDDPVEEDGERIPAPRGMWWLVLQDQGSIGQVVDVHVGGTLVATLKSGDPQTVVDLGPQLLLGSNEVVFTTRAESAPSGKELLVYVGKGGNREGTLKLDAPQIRFVAGPESQPGTMKSYQLLVE